MANMENFPKALCSVALLLEPLGHRDQIWTGIPEMGSQVIDTKRRWPES